MEVEAETRRRELENEREREHEMRLAQMGRPVVTDGDNNAGGNVAENRCFALFVDQSQIFDFPFVCC